MRKGWSNRWWDALSGFRRDPQTAAGFARQLNHLDGWELSRYLWARLPTEVVRGLAGALLVHDEVCATLSFERRGIRWTVDMGDVIGYSLYSQGHYEGPEIDAVLAWLSARSDAQVVVDAGANVGTTSLPLAMAGYHVVAVEPVPRTVQMLRANVENNGLADRITVVPVALAEEPRDLEMWIAKGSGQSEIVVPEAEGRDPQRLRQSPIGKITVRSMRLDEILVDLEIGPSEVGLVWADVQGSEASIIRSAPGLWSAGAPLYIEVDPVSIRVHEGTSRFVALVGEHFSRFVPSGDLPDGTPAPVTSLRQFIESIPDGAFTDALLIP